METPTFRLLKCLGILGPKITQHVGWWNEIIDHHSSHGQGSFLVNSTDWTAQISPRCGANCALRRQAGQSLVAQGSTVYFMKSTASSDFNFTNFLQVEFVSVFQCFQLESITLTNSQKTRLFFIFGGWVVKFCQSIKAELRVDQVGTAWQSSFATLERQGADSQGWLPHSNWKAANTKWVCSLLRARW